MTNEDVLIDDSSELCDSVRCDLARLLVTDILINHLSVIEINSTHSSPATVRTEERSASCGALKLISLNDSILQYFYQIDKDLHLQCLAE